MKIVIAKDAGYCFGVRDAVNLAYDVADKYKDVYMLGDIVHNENVVKDLNKAGAKVVENIEDIPKDKKILFRAHGTKPDVWKQAESEGRDIIDATCPLVHKIHKEVKELSSEGRRIIVIGDHKHDEVVAISSQVENAIVVANKEEALNLNRFRRLGVVSQSTQMIENVQDIVDVLMTKSYDLRFINTICFPTKKNHEQIKDLANEYDLVIIIGSFTSANSKRLTKMSKMINEKTYQVTCAEELNKEWFKNVSSVGISAGASTPDYLIDEVANKIKEITNNKKS